MVSIIICTYNRENLLREALESLVSQQGKFEIVVVDNNSTDGTGEMIKQYSGLSNLVYVKENIQGLSYARNRGWREAKYDYVGYIDDDGRATDGFIKEACHIIEEFSPDAFAGPIYPYYNTPVPSWFKDEYETHYHYSTSGWLPRDTKISGGNMFFRKSVLEKSEGFSEHFGMVGDQIGYGEESELIQRLYDQGSKLYYSLDLRAEHIVRENKLNMPFLAMRNFEQGRARAKISYPELPDNDIFLRNELMIVESLLGDLQQKLVEVYNAYLENKGEMEQESLMVEKIFPEFYRIGMEYERLLKINARKPGFLKKLAKVNLDRVLTYLKRS